MSDQFSAGPRLVSEPIGDPKRQAVASLRGYAYQLYASALAWISLRHDQQLYLEVAEDYAVVANGALQGVQVKDTAASGTITINSHGAREAVDGFVDLLERNPDVEITLRFLSTAAIGREHRVEDRANGKAVLGYWRDAARGADVGPLRVALMKANLSDRVKAFISERSDDQLRADLLKRIHWDCGQPELGEIQGELAASLIAFCSERLQLSPSDCEPLPAVVLGGILDAVLAPGSRRRLVAADLLKLCEETTKVSVSKSTMTTLLQRLAVGADPGAAAIAALHTRRVLEPELELPLPCDFAPRAKLVTDVLSCLSACGLAFLTGGTGVGKTMAARLAARSFGGRWFVLDVRDLSAGESARRLRMAVGQLPALAAAGIIVDDLNEAEVPEVSNAMASLLTSLRRCDAVCLITLYRTPSVGVHDRLGGSSASVLHVPSLDQDEIGELVAAAGGDPKSWARYVYLRGGFGHPQLVRALLSGLRRRNWPTLEIGLRSAEDPLTVDLEVERRAVRQRLLDALGENGRVLLYRSSLLIGRFDRSLAMHIAAISPQVPLPGEALDELVGPWIELSGHQTLRVSPLVANVGEDVLTQAEQAIVHYSAATSLTVGASIDVHRADALFVHSVKGGCELALGKLAHAIVRVEERKHELLAEWLPHSRAAATDVFIYGKNPTISRLLRLCQLLLTSPSNDAAAIARVWASLDREIREEADVAARESFEYMVLAKVLISRALAGVLPDWLRLLTRFDELTESRPQWKALADSLQTASSPVVEESLSVIGILFLTQAMAFKNVADQERVFSELDRFSPATRDRYLFQAEAGPGGPSVLVNAPWLAESRRGPLNWTAAASSYWNMANLAAKWGHRELALCFHAARCVMLDEYAPDGEAALAAISTAEGILGADPRLSRARAKLHFRRGRHADVLASLKEHSDLIAKNDPVERAYVCREAAISSAETGDWAEANKWFARAYVAAASTKGEILKPMAVGLRADEALANFLAGNPVGSVSTFSEALEMLPSLDANKSTAAAYCNRVVRHALLWLFDQATGQSGDLTIDGHPPKIVAGMCSNPEPPDSIRDLPCASFDTVWYVFAAVQARYLDVDSANKMLIAKMVGRTIPSLEIMTRTAFVANSVRRVDVDGFVGQLHLWIDSLAYLATHSEALRSSNMIHPTYNAVPRATGDQLQLPIVQNQVQDAILAFGMMAAMNSADRALPTLQAALQVQEGLEGGRRLLLAMMQREDHASQTRAEFICEAIRSVLAGQDRTPEELFTVTLRFVQATRGSAFSREVEPRLVDWARTRWRRAIGARFAFRNPNTTIPAIEEALQRDILPGLAAILLAAEPGVNIRLDPGLRDMLTRLASP